jgi:transposase
MQPRNNRSTDGWGSIKRRLGRKFLELNTNQELGGQAMKGSIQLTAEERKTLLQVYRSGDARLARRAHVLLLLDDGFSYRDLQAILYASNFLIADCLRRFRHGGIQEALEPHRPFLPASAVWLPTVLSWLKDMTPKDFGYFRQRWTCAMLAEVLAWEKDIHLSAETVRRGLRQAGFVWRRPRPILGPTDPEYTEKIEQLRRLMDELPDDETVVFEDEVDIHLNPKIGSCWMPRGEQATVVTPGNNEKRHLAGSLHWRTGRLLLSDPSQRRNADLFVAHLDDLRCRLRCYRRIHVICDNARFHDCQAVRDYLSQWGERIVLHFLPTYAPEANPIERVWWHLHETITRNHRCQSMQELLDNTFEWVVAHGRFPVEVSVYNLAA